MQTVKKQQGMTMIGWLLVIILFVCLALVAMRLIPVYLDGYKVSQSMESLSAESGIGSKSIAELRKMLMRRLDVNMVNDVTAEDVTFTRRGNVITIEIKYEARRKLFGNLYAVVVFSKTTEIQK